MLSNEQELSKPIFYRLSNSQDKTNFDSLIANNPTIKINDRIWEQLEELVKVLNPSVKFSKNKLNDFVVKHIDGKDIKCYGVWVYYPWNGNLIHLLDEKEFIQVRTNRNHNKITKAEQTELSKTKIGVVGLSVGQSVSLALAMERSFGELRIADFDTLELGNLNRIRSGLHNLGLQKTTVVAREIAEIDPFLKVKIFAEGLTPENISSFLNDGGKLDILVDECDSLDIKIMMRQQAKIFSIPVLMDTSDRGMIDVERFDIEPERPILHGLIDHLDISDLKNLTDFEKIPYVMSILDEKNISDRMKLSMGEIGKTLVTWPQLASSVLSGGAITADVCRKITLNQFKKSGRYYIDLDQIFSNNI